MNNQPLPPIECVGPDRSPVFELRSWVAAWPHVRDEVAIIAASYAEVYPEGNSRLLAPLIEEIEGALRLLLHRTTWMQEHTAVLEREANG